MEEKDTQLVYISIDDSGKLVENEKVAIYAGIVFTNKLDKDKFITMYKSIVNNIKCKYCKDVPENCNTIECPELKHSKLKPEHNRQLFNHIKRFSIVACIINNTKVYDYIKNNTATRGRYLDYALKLSIKNVFKGLIKDHKINPYKPIKLILNIDEQTTKSNGYYNLKDSIYEELKEGISNFNYNKIYTPILFSNFEISLNYHNSNKSFLIQAADLVAGTVRRLYLNNINNLLEFYKRTGFINYPIFLP